MTSRYQGCLLVPKPEGMGATHQAHAIMSGKMSTARGAVPGNPFPLQIEADAEHQMVARDC